MGSLFPDHIDHIEQLHGPIQHGSVSALIKKYKGNVARIEAIVSQPHRFNDPTNGLPFATMTQMIKHTSAAGFEGRQSYHLDWQLMPDGHSAIREIAQDTPVAIDYMG